MGQTLTHGIYLPDEGERNCYSGLAANWQLLDGAVGTVAEHSTQIAGKAPAVHTHTKSDVTDLFNSANVWTKANTFSKALTVAKNSDTNFFFNAKHTAAELGSLPNSDQALTLAFKDKNDDNLCYARVYYETTGGNSFRIFVRNKYTSGAPSTSGTVDYAYFGLKINADKYKEAVFRASLRPYDSTNAYNLGDTTYKWKTLNGVNPGALSLPDYSKADGLDVSAQGLNWDLTGATINTYTPTFDGYLSLRCKDTNGDFFIVAYGGSNAIIRNCVVGTGILPGTAGLSLLIPMLASTPINIRVKATTNFKAYITPCFGNV